MRDRHASRRRGFTLIELIAVVVVLAILAGVALPKYFDWADQAKLSACEGALGGVRAGIANFYANQAMSGSAQYPTASELSTIGTVMQEAIPENPYNGLKTVKSTTTASDATNRVTDGTTGWYYYIDDATTPTTYAFWANSDTAGVDENEL